MYIEKDSISKTVKPEKGTDGVDGPYAGDDGSDGQNGKAGINMILSLYQLLPNSDTRLDFISDGGDGGNGGNGREGKPPGQVPWSPKNAEEVALWVTNMIEGQYNSWRLCLAISCLILDPMDPSGSFGVIEDHH